MIKILVQVSFITIGRLDKFDDKKRFSNSKNLMIKHKNTIRKKGHEGQSRVRPDYDIFLPFSLKTLLKVQQNHLFEKFQVWLKNGYNEIFFIQVSCITIGSFAWFDDKKRFSNSRNLMIKHKNTVRKIYIGYDTGKLCIHGEIQRPLRLASLRWCVKKATKTNVE